MRQTRNHSIYLFVMAAISLMSCQNGLENEQDINIRAIKYNVALSQSTITKAADKSAGAELTLSDKTGSLTIPMESEVSEGISFVPESVITKGTQVNTTGDDNKTLGTFADIVGTFYASAYDSNGTEKVSQTVTWSNGAWIGNPVTYWPQATSLNFLAYANLPSGQTATIASTGVSTSHTVPATASEQTDILFGHYQGNGGNTGTAEIRFDHPLTAVRFKWGLIDDGLVIKSISLTGVAGSGTATKATDGTIAWSGISSYACTVSQSDDSGLSVDATTSVIGEPFLIIPQNLANHNVEVTVTFTDGTEVVATLTSGDWKAGYTNTYTLNYGDGAVTLTASIPEVYNGTPLGGNMLNDNGLEDYNGSPLGDPGYVVIGEVKWAKQNLAISASGNMKWKGGNGSAVKVPGTDEDVLNGDYFQWAACEGYCGDASDGDKGLLIYTSFTSTKCVDGGSSDAFTFKSGYSFNGTSLPYYNGSSFTKYASFTQVTLETAPVNDDAASIILGDGWRMPTATDYRNLCNNTYWQWESMDMGYYVYSPITDADKGKYNTNPDSYDKSEALLFFPAVGYGDYGDNGFGESVGQIGNYWTSSLYTLDSDPATASPLHSSAGLLSPELSYGRYAGFSVRPVSDQ